MNNKISEDCFFFVNQKGQYLYGCTYEPRSVNGKTGLVIVPPVGHERLRCLRECVNLARVVACAGFPVLRFDYRGEGESFGNFSDFDMISRLHDIDNAVSEMKKRFIVDHVILVGLRLGALFSVKAAVGNDIDNLILCEPVYNLENFVRNCIRAHIIARRDYFGDDSLQEQNIWQSLHKGEAINVYGFPFTLTFLKQLQEFDMIACLKAFRGKALIVNFYKSKCPDSPPLKVRKWCEHFGQDAVVRVEAVRTFFSWTTKKVWTPVLQEFNECIVRWILENGR